MNDVDVVVIGGGIIGAATAWQLSARGLSVLVCDAGPPRLGTSFANAGHVVVSHSIPFAAPGMVESGLRSWRTRTGAFSINPTIGVAGFQWLASFPSHCTEANVARFQPALQHLLSRTSALISESFASVIRSRTGLWQVFTGEGAEKRRDHELEHLHHYGVAAHAVSGDDARAAESLLTSRVQAALELPHDFALDPYALWNDVREHSVRSGSTWLPYARVDDIKTDTSGVTVNGQQGPIRAKYAVVAAGVWSRGLAQSLKFTLPMIAAKGYSVTLEEAANGLSRPLLLADQYTAVSPLNDSLRISARFELTSSTDRSINQSVISHIIERAREALDLPPTPADVKPWTGLRPASVDGAPFLGFLDPRVVVATGHGMLGTSMSLGTGEAVADLLVGTPLAEPLTALTPARHQ